ncbi:hypothetical protein RQP46_004673 [Phenoliferia psychrophenolica]
MAIMKPETYASHVKSASNGNHPDGDALAELFQHSRPDGTEPTHVNDLYKGIHPGDHNLDNPRPSYATAFGSKLDPQWYSMALEHTRVIIAMKQDVPLPLVAFDRQHELVKCVSDTFYRWLVGSSANEWSLPVLYAICHDLKRLATLADVALVKADSKPSKLEQASRLLQKCFSACLNDRASDISRSRKMGTYYMAVLLFKTYFRLKSTALCKNIVKGIRASELPPLEHYPAAHQVAYNYYLGVFAFLREDYLEAEQHFLSSLSMIKSTSYKNIDFILDYLIPILLLRGVRPSEKVLNQERHGRVFRPFIDAIKSGDVRGYDEQLRVAEKRLMERGTYLIVERAREGAVRTLLKKAWICENKPTRMPIASFAKMYNLGADPIDTDEVECMLANMIYKNLIKGYIAHGPQVVVLSKALPFPWYAPFAPLPPKAKEAREAKEVAARNKLPDPLPIEVANVVMDVDMLEIDSSMDIGK